MPSVYYQALVNLIGVEHLSGFEKANHKKKQPRKWGCFFNIVL